MARRTASHFAPRGRRRARLPVAAALVAIVAAAALVLTLVGHVPGTSGHRAPPAPGHDCPKGCAVVSVSTGRPYPALYYGVSCSGTAGPWFLNAVGSGSVPGVIRPSYRLTFSFNGGESVVRPNGTVTVPPGGASHLAMTISAGTLHLVERTATHPHVAAEGAIVVRLVSAGGHEALSISVSGPVVAAEHRLGVVSPLAPAGNTTVLPIRLVPSSPSCSN